MSTLVQNTGSSTFAINFQEFSLTYFGSKNNHSVQALQNVSLAVNPGEIITIVGPSGCGKTTLLRAIAGLLTSGEDNAKFDGSLHVFGKSPSEAKQERMFAFTFQNPALLPWRNVWQNVSLPLEIMKQSDANSHRLIDEMLSMVGIREFAKAMPSEISGGMQQRANLARALVQEPKVLLMDEPFGSLDEVTRERMNFELLRIHRLRRPTILFVTHNLSEATLLADRILIMSERPATIREEIHIQFNQERNEDILLAPEYLDMVRKVRRAFTKVS